MTILGTALVCFIFLAGLTDVIFIYGQIPSLLLVVTAIAIAKQKENRIAVMGGGAAKVYNYFVSEGVPTVKH